MRIKWEKLVPVGTDCKKERKAIIAGLAIAAVYSLIFIIEFGFSVVELYESVGKTTILIDGKYMADFAELLKGNFVLFTVMICLLVILGAVHYVGHFSGSRSIYTMRRIPQRWELFIRCAALPAMGIAACLVAELILTLLYFAIYMIFTPRGHIAPGQVEKLISSILEV